LISISQQPLPKPSDEKHNRILLYIRHGRPIPF
jgi:hypothetical protein